MLREQARRFISSVYAFFEYVDAVEFQSYEYPGELDLESLGRFRAGHPECPGDVAPVSISDKTWALIGQGADDCDAGKEEEESSEESRPRPFQRAAKPPPLRFHHRPRPSLALELCWAAVAILFLICSIAILTAYVWIFISLLLRVCSEVLGDLISLLSWVRQSLGYVRA